MDKRIYQVYVQRKGQNHFNVVGDYQGLRNAVEIEDYYKKQSWCTGTYTEEKKFK